MDPITLWILVLATGWIIRALVEDGAAAVAAARGHPYTSPRIVRREARQRLALERIAAGGSPPLTVVFSEKLADRIANPPDRQWLREVREYLALIVADGFEDARTRHEDRRAEKRQGQPPGPNPRRPAPAVDDIDADIVDADIVDDDRPVCEVCGRRYDIADQHPLQVDMNYWYVPPCRSCWEAESQRRTPDDNTDVGGASREAPPSNSTPALPAAASTRKDSSVTNTINGDVGSPSEALQFCESTLDLNTACCNEIDTALAGLRGAGCGQGFLDIITGGLGAADIFHNAVSDARVRYARHVLAHADLTSDPDLRNTLVGYLSADKV